MPGQTIVRTPRRRKEWLERHTFIDLTAASKFTDRVLNSSLTAMGLSQIAGLTIMRTVGSVALCHGATDDSAATWNWLRLGLAWVPTEIATAGATDAQVPDPLQDATRETRWIQQWILGAFTKTSGSTGGFEVCNATGPMGLPWLDVDVTQMSKQPSRNHELILRGVNSATLTSGTMRLRVDLSFLVALP